MFTCLAIRSTGHGAPGHPSINHPPISHPSLGCPSVPEEDHRSTLFYESVVRPTCEQLGLTLLRADRLMDAGLPENHLPRLIAEVDIVVADLSGSDEELVFALGMRHALGRCTVHVTEGRGTLRGTGRTPSVEFPSHSAGATRARQQLTAVLADISREAPFTLSPSAPPPASPAPPTSVLSTLAEDDAADAPGFIDLAVEAEAQFQAISGDMADVEAAMADLTAMMELLGEDMTRLGHPGVTTSAKLAILNRLAKAIDGPARDLEVAAERFAERMTAGVVAFNAFLDWVAKTPRAEWPDNVPGILDDLLGTSSTVQVAAGDLTEVTGLINMVGAASRHLRGPIRRIIGSFQTLFRSVAVFEEWRARAVALKQD